MLDTTEDSKDELISDVLLRTLTHEHTSVGRLAKTCSHQFYANTGCLLDHLHRAMTDRDGRDGWLVSLFNGISTLFRLFNAKVILLEEQ